MHKRLLLCHIGDKCHGLYDGRHLIGFTLLIVEHLRCVLRRRGIRIGICAVGCLGIRCLRIRRIRIGLTGMRCCEKVFLRLFNLDGLCLSLFKLFACKLCKGRRLG